ncbi:MAG TPA: UDP-glucose 4-epimerase GalE [Bacteroidia bacterium]|nr:UDP-glucose 4-epimerase GalE [Bacteroidia bacterium]
MTAKSNILVTGGAGFIGSHTSVELINDGHNVFIIDNLSNSRIEAIEGIAQITGTQPYFEQFDLCDREKLNKFFSKNKIDAIIHFAALKAVGESVQKPLEYYKNNLLSNIHLLEMCIQHRVKGLVFSSSCSVYGEPDTLPVSEKAPLKKAESPYANTKRMCEDMIRDSVLVSNINAIILRYFNPVGAHASAVIGELPLGTPNNLMPVITQTAIGKRSGFEVFGTDYDTPDGSCIRDYIHVVDLAKAHVVAVNRLLNGANKEKCETFNLGTGNGISVLEMILAFEKHTGMKLNYKLGGRRAGDVVKVYSDTQWANEELQWKAQLGLKEMVESAWKWEQKMAEKVV